MKRGILYACLVIISVVICIILFRTETGNRYPFGRYKIKYRWGKPTYLIVDRNSDGIPDYKDLLPGSFHNHTTPIETWIDLDLDGYFERHIVWDNSGFQKLSRLEIDHDEDGYPDEVLHGDSADKIWPQIKETLINTRVIKDE